jgi:hypothetical protein
MTQTILPTPLQRAWAGACASAQRLWSSMKPQPAVVPADWFTEAEVGGYDASFAADDPQRIDDATWRDLEGQALLGRLADGASLYARQYLFQRLRRGAGFERGRRPAWMSDDAANDAVLRDTEPARLDLRREDMAVTGLLFHGELVPLSPALRHVRWAKALWMAGLVVLLRFSAPGIAALLGLGYLLVWGAVEVRFHARLQRWKRQRRAVLAMLRAIVALGAVARRRAHPVLEDIAVVADEAQRLLVALDLDAMEHQAIRSDYVNLLTMHDYAVAPPRRARLEAELPALRTLYVTLAECDGRLALIAYLAAHRETCWARPCAPRALRLVGLRHPLLAAAQPLSLDLRSEGAFLSGENGVGKSTLLRAVGLNLLLARAFGFCHAAQAEVPPLPVWSSMVHEDSIEVGDSLYMAEMRRAQALLQVAERPDAAIFLIDEVFRGTNHLESVACAAAVLNRLAAAGMVIVSSHSAVLAPLLRARLAPWRVVRAGAGLVLEPGVLQAPNGIEMMRRYAIADAVRDEAQRVHDWFAGHVATPVAFPPLA